MRRHADAQRDRGAALALVVVFTVMIGAISASLVPVVNSTLTHRTTLETVRNREYAADAAVEVAITQARAFTCATSPGYTVDASTNHTSIRVEWQNACGTVVASDGSDYPQRNVIFTACENTGASCVPDAVIVRTQVNFEPASGPVTRTVVQSWSVHR